MSPAANDRKLIPIKLVLLGESAVGKSSLVIRYVNRQFIEDKEPTIGVDDERMIKFEIWDTAGQERFHSLAPMYYRNAQAAIIMYDVTKASTLDKAKGWVKELQRQAHSQIVIALIGNKSDLVAESDESDEVPSLREVPKEEALAYANEVGLLFFETSAKLGVNIDIAFKKIAECIPYEYMNSLNGKRGGNSNTNLTTLDMLRDNSANNNQSSSKCAC